VELPKHQFRSSRGHRQNLTPGQRYLFRVFAISGLGTGLSSNVAVTGNQAPTDSLEVAPRNPTTGVVNGNLRGTDPNGDKLTYTLSMEPAKGTVVLTTTGQFTYTPTLTALQPNDRNDSFTVTITDGYGGNTPVSIVVPLV